MLFYLFRMEKEVHRELNCPVCMDTLTIPKLLTCMHTFCEACLLPLVDKSNIYCPVCRHQTVLTDGTKGLSTNFIAQNVIEALEAMSLTSNGCETKKCGECDQDTAVNFCVDCYLRMCVVCTDYHKRSVKYRGHVVAPFHEVSHKQMCQGRIKKCSKHDEVLKYFCNECHFTICHDCTVSKNHTGHDFNLLDEIATENKETLRKLVTKAEEKRKIVDEITTCANERLEDICKTNAQSVSVIEETFQHIYDVVNTLQVQMVKNLHDQFEKNKNSIVEASESSRILSECVAFTNEVIENRCNAEIMDIFKNLKHQLEEISHLKPLVVVVERKVIKNEVEDKKRKRVSFNDKPLPGHTEERGRSATSPESILKNHRPSPVNPNPVDVSEEGMETSKKKFFSKSSIKSLASKSSKGMRSSFEKLKKQPIEETTPSIRKEEIGSPVAANPPPRPARPPPMKAPPRPANPPPKPPAPKQTDGDNVPKLADRETSSPKQTIAEISAAKQMNGDPPVPKQGEGDMIINGNMIVEVVRSPDTVSISSAEGSIVSSMEGSIVSSLEGSACSSVKEEEEIMNEEEKKVEEIDEKYLRANKKESESKEQAKKGDLPKKAVHFAGIQLKYQEITPRDDVLEKVIERLENACTQSSVDGIFNVTQTVLTM